ncbi:MAG: ABC transporter permease [Chloroflexi bacterium]|nr:ABC transporter permease [Chloroflexota bacterium]
MRTLLKLTWVELKLFVREPVTMFFTLVFPIIVLFVMGGVFANTPDPDAWRGVGAMNFYTPAYIGLVIASIGLVGLPVHLSGYRERGVLRRLRASPIHVLSIFSSQILVSFVIAVVGAIVITAVAMPVYDVAAPEDLALLLAAFVISVLTFASIGILLGSVLPTTRAAQGVGLVLFFIMFMISGGGPPPEVMNEPMRRLADLTPLKYVIIMLQDPWLGFSWNMANFGIVAGFLVVPGLLSVRFFRWE